MRIGLLWYDDDPRRGLEDKVGRAAERYREKYGRWPNTCYVHPTAMAGGAGQVLRLASPSREMQRTIRLVSAPNVLLHHYWLGEGTKKSEGRNKVAA